MRLGWYRAVHVKNVDMQKMRTLLSNRKLQKRKHREPHSWRAAAYGLLVGFVARSAYEARVRELLERGDPIFAMIIEAMLGVRRAILEGYDRLHRVLLQVVQHDPVCRRLMTVPGVGPVAALSFKVGVDDPRRSARSRTVGGPRTAPPFGNHICILPEQALVTFKRLVPEPRIEVVPCSSAWIGATRPGGRNRALESQGGSSASACT
jgi:hypothetical protein